MFQAVEKRAPEWGGGLPRERVGSKSSFPPSLECPPNLLECSKSLHQEKFMLISRPLLLSLSRLSCPLFLSGPRVVKNTLPENALVF